MKCTEYFMQSRTLVLLSREKDKVSQYHTRFAYVYICLSRDSSNLTVLVTPGNSWHVVFKKQICFQTVCLQYLLTLVAQGLSPSMKTLKLTVLRTSSIR